MLPTTCMGFNIDYFHGHNIERPQTTSHCACSRSGFALCTEMCVDTCIGYWNHVYHNGGMRQYYCTWASVSKCPVTYMQLSVHMANFSNMFIFKLCMFLISLSYLDCIHHYIWQSCNHSVMNKIPVSNSTLYKMTMLSGMIYISH